MGGTKTGEARETCTFCKKTIHNPDIKEAGNHAGNSTNLGNNIMEYPYKQPGKSVGDHPLSNPRYILTGKLFGEDDPKEEKCVVAQAHHLIPCQIMAKDDNWAVICKNYGYNIDNSHNGIILPADMRVACHEKIPLHKGNHNKTTTESEKMNYVAAAKNMVAPVYDLAIAKDYCNAEADIIDHLNEISNDICLLVITFAWTLTDMGTYFNHGGKGCLGALKIPRLRIATLPSCPKQRNHGIIIAEPYFKEK